MAGPPRAHFAPDWREPEADHARSLAIYWSRLPADACRALGAKWLARCAEASGH